MAVSTQKTLRNQVMYQVFVRNFSDEGTFAAVQSRLDEIKALGTDIIWYTIPMNYLREMMAVVKMWVFDDMLPMIKSALFE